MITYDSFLQPSRLGRGAVDQATGAQTRVGSIEKKQWAISASSVGTGYENPCCVGINRPVRSAQEALDTKIGAYCITERKSVFWKTPLYITELKSVFKKHFSIL